MASETTVPAPITVAGVENQLSFWRSQGKTNSENGRHSLIHDCDVDHYALCLLGGVTSLRLVTRPNGYTVAHRQFENLWECDTDSSGAREPVLSSSGKSSALPMLSGCLRSWAAVFHFRPKVGRGSKKPDGMNHSAQMVRVSVCSKLDLPLQGKTA